MPKRVKTRGDLEAEIRTLKACLLNSLKFAHEELKSCGVDRYKASGLIVTVTNLSGKEVVMPFMCQDGLEGETIKALQAQIKKTQALNLINIIKE